MFTSAKIILQLLFLMCFVALSIAASHTTQTQYRMYPLIQDGGNNLAPPITKSLEEYSLKGNATYAAVDGKQCIRLETSKNNRPAGFKFFTPVIPNTLLSVSFRFQFSQDAAFYYASQIKQGIHGWITLRDSKKYNVNTWRISERRNTLYWSTYETEVYTTRFGKDLKLNLTFSGAKGYVLVSDMKVYAKEIQRVENRMLILPPQGTSDFSYAKVSKHPRLSPTDRLRTLGNSQINQAKIYPGEPERSRSAAIYHRPDPDSLFFYTRPSVMEFNAPLKMSLTPGETGITTLAVHALRNLSGVKLRISQLKNETEQEYPGRVEWKVIKYNPKRLDYYGRGRTWHWVADFFFEATEGRDVVQNESVTFWITSTAKSDATPGIYFGKIYVETKEGTLGVNEFTIKIRPFYLVDADDKTRGLYADIGRWKSFTDDQIIRELSDFKEHGINCMLIPSGRPVVGDNEITGWDFDTISQRYIDLILQAKLSGPFISWFGWLDRWLANHFCIPISEIEKDPVQWPEEVKKAYKKCLTLAKEEFKRRGWNSFIFHAVDEPRYSKKGSPEQFSWKYKTARDVGLETYCTSSYLPSDPLGVNLTYHCYGKSILTSPKRTSFIKEKTHEAGQKFWYYATGSYSGQIGNIVRNRYLSGFIFFRSGAEGQMSWTFQRPHGDPFDDFYAGKTGQPCITYPDPKHAGENLDTPQWEGLRQGWYDYRYAATLAKIAEKSTDAKSELDRILNSMPWNGDVFRDGAVTNEKCDKWREEIAEAIERFSN